MSDREEFERKFPVPKNVIRCGDRYAPTEYSADQCYGRMWQAWQAARESEGGEAVAKVVESEQASEIGASVVVALGDHVLLPGDKLYTHPPKQQSGVPDFDYNHPQYCEIIERITEATHELLEAAGHDAEYLLDMDEAIEANIYKNILMVATEISGSTPQPDKWIEPDLFWDYHNTEDSSHEDEHDLADYCAQDLPYGETMTVDVMCAKRLPARQMKIWVDEDDDLQWEWLTDATPPEQESE